MSSVIISEVYLYSLSLSLWPPPLFSIHIISVFQICADGEQDIPARFILMVYNVQNHFLQLLWYGQMHYILNRTALRIRGSLWILFCILFCNNTVIAVDTIWSNHALFGPQWWVITWFSMAIYLVLIAFVSALILSKVVALYVKVLQLDDDDGGRCTTSPSSIATAQSSPSSGRLYGMTSSPPSTASLTTSSGKLSVSQRLTQRKRTENVTDRMTRIAVLYFASLALWMVILAALLVTYRLDGGAGSVGWEFAAYILILIDIVKNFVAVMLSYDYYKTYYLKQYTFGRLHSHCVQWMRCIARWRRRKTLMETRLAMEVESASALDGDDEAVEAPRPKRKESEHLAVPTQSTLTATTAIPMAEPDELVLAIEAVPPSPSPDVEVDDVAMDTARSHSASSLADSSLQLSGEDMDGVILDRVILGTMDRVDEGSNEDSEGIGIEIAVDSPQNVQRLRVSLPSGRQGTDTRNMEEILSGILDGSPDVNELSTTL